MRLKDSTLGSRKSDSINTYTCDHCGTSYLAYRCHAERTGKSRYFCSAECKNASQKRLTPIESDVDRFWEKVDTSGGDNSCWIWQAAQTSTGYGKMAWPGHSGPYAAHRISFLIANGREAIGMVRHTCDTPLCVNPTHLLEGDQLANMGDAALRGRTALGVRNGMAILTEDDVIAIRARYKRRHPLDGAHIMAKEYGVSQAAIMNVVKRKSWKHVP